MSVDRPEASGPAPCGVEGSAALASLSAARILLVACDFDGTLSPIAPRPELARADPRALGALRALAALPRTWCAVVSGRGREELERLLGSHAGPPVLLVGSHGAEGPFWGDAPHAEEIERAAVIRAELGRIAAEHPGAIAEAKPFGGALHVRGCSDHDQARALEAADRALGSLAGLHRMSGHAVAEYSVRPHDKGGALATLRYRLAASRAVFIGDDRTDEDAFALLSGDDLGVRVGPGPTLASMRLDCQERVAPLLEDLLERRRSHLASEKPVRITDHGLLSDQRTVGLVDHRGGVSWLCLPRADSSSLFGRLLGRRGGSFVCRPELNEGPGRQSYLNDTMILRTAWPEGTVTDYLDCSAGRAFQRPGRSDLIRVIEGRGAWRLHFEPAPDYGRGGVELTLVDHGIRIDAGNDTASLLSPGVRWALRSAPCGQAACATVELGTEPLVLEFRWGMAGAPAAAPTQASRRAQTERFWSGWASTLRLPPLAPELVKRSALVLKALCHGPSGGILAAATTSLPEQAGGVRNWDYRFCWPRDACLSALALLRLGNTGVAMKLLDWLAAVVAETPSPDRLRPIYTVSGGALWPEAEISTLEGYHHSAPVRVGNAADNQVQLDVFGPIVDLVAASAREGSPVTPEHWRLVQSMVEAVALRWREPDHGIWEIRGPRQRHVHSAVMGWLAATRAAGIASDVTGRERPEWRRLAEDIREDLVRHAYCPRLEAFPGVFGGEHLDAAALWVLLSGMLPPDDRRAVSTVRAVEHRLRRGPVVDRYRLDDGLPGLEGGFVITAFWLAEALWLIGDRASARDLFDQTCALAGPTGLLAEQHDPLQDEPLGNYPQAYSHLGLINAAVRLSGL